jgi:hypothetical protein
MLREALQTGLRQKTRVFLIEQTNFVLPLTACLHGNEGLGLDLIRL